MKKFNYLLLGLAGLTMASCSQEDVMAPGTGDGNFAVTVKLPANLDTRALSQSSGLVADKLLYAVYDNDDNNSFVFQGEADFNGQLQTTVSFNLPKDKSYNIAFFAVSEDGTKVYDFQAENGIIEVNYDNYMSDPNLADAYDCFYKFHYTGVIGSSTVYTEATLTRPVAQINWGTNDLNEAVAHENAFGENGKYIVSNLEIAQAYTQFSLINSDVVEESLSESPVTIQGLASPVTAEDVTWIYPVIPSQYTYVSMQYVLASKDGNTYDLSLNIDNSGREGATTIENDAVNVSSAPVQANYQTNIYGSLLTDDLNITVDKNPGFNMPEYNIIDGAMVEFTDEGIVKCITPNLPDGVTEEDMEGYGAVAVGNGSSSPYFIQPTGSAIQAAIKMGYNEFYFTPNATITTGSHTIQVPSTGLTIHGNGATLTGGEHDISIQTGGTYYSSFEDGSIVNINIENLNGVKVWGTVEGDCTINVNLTNCTYSDPEKGIEGKGSFVMIRSDDPVTTINLDIENCWVQKSQVGIHDTYAGTVKIDNCKFTNVGVPVNIAKKTTENLYVNVTNCVFDTCGIDPESKIEAYDYAAPVRVVDNAGPANSITLLVDACTFINTQSDWDILLVDYRAGKKWYPVNYTILNCSPADPSVLATVTD